MDFSAASALEIRDRFVVEVGDRDVTLLINNAGEDGRRDCARKRDKSIVEFRGAAEDCQPNRFFATIPSK